MKKIAKVVLAAALVLLVFGAFTGAAAAVSPAPIDEIPADAQTQIVFAPAAEIHADAAAAPAASRVVKIAEIKGKSGQLHQLTSPRLPVHILPAFIVTADASIFRP